MKYCGYRSEAVFTTLHFYVNYEWALQARFLYYTRLEGLVGDKQSSLLGSDGSNEELRK
jgi:hypothetical protein